ncbi:MAG: efflux RND transporter periplasmic adaptor subunit [Rhodospirillaceae bacterium]|nr:MAG: efflux RND transporter periplasmic adaptor subunit [Rhodospirillaceae bacterium]
MSIFEGMTSKHRKVARVVAALIAAFVAWQILSWLFGHNAAKPETAIPVVAGQTVASDVPLYLDGIGTIRAYNTVTVRARVDGELVAVTFREGQDVKKGDVLAQIDPRPFRALLDNALSNLARDQASLANAQHDLVRYQDLSAKGFATHQQVDTQSATVNSLSATVRSDEASIRNARVQLGYTTITAPIDGRTGIRAIDVGNIIHATDAGGLVVIAQIQPISAIFTLPQSELAKVVGEESHGPLKATAFDSDNATALEDGVLELVDNIIDPTTGTVRLKARFPNARQALWPGEFVNVRLQVGDIHNGITVPAEAVQRGPHGLYAYVIKSDDTVEMRSVETGQERDGQTLVTKGLNAGERVVIDGQLRLAPGMKVQSVGSGNRQPGSATEAASNGANTGLPQGTTAK